MVELPWHQGSKIEQKQSKTQLTISKTKKINLTKKQELQGAPTLHHQC